MITDRDNLTVLTNATEGSVKPTDADTNKVLSASITEKLLKSLDQKPAPVAADSAPEPQEVVSKSDPLPAKRVPKIDEFGYSYATGKRKNAIARVWVKPGQGQMVLNKNKKPEDYFQREILLQLIRRPLVISKSENFNVRATVKGGGIVGQAEALMYGIAKALNIYDPNLRPVLKQARLLTRDARIVERKKYGRAKARKKFQFSKR